MALKMMNISKTIREQIPIIYCAFSLLILLLLLLMVEVDGFLPKSQYYYYYYRQHFPPIAIKNIQEERIATTIVSLASRYGPPTDDLLKDLGNQRDDDDDDDDDAQDRHPCPQAFQMWLVLTNEFPGHNVMRGSASTESRTIGRN